MRNIIIVLLSLFVLSSCEWYQDVDIVEVGKVKLDGINGNNASINLDVELNNPNWYGIKVKPSFLSVYVEDEYVGKAHLLEKVKFKRKKVATYNLKVDLLGEKGVLKKAMKYALKKELKIRLEGKVKAGVFIISKKFEVDETKTIDGRKFRPSVPFFN